MPQRIISGKPSLLKDINRHLLMKLIIRHDKIGRAELAKMSNLSLPSVMRITDALIEEGLLVQIGKGESSGGRKPNLLMLNHEALYIIGVEIALKTTVVLSDLSGSPIEKWTSDEAPYTTPELMLEKIEEEIRHLLKKHKVSVERLAGIGIGTPGSDFKHLKEMELFILKGWESLDVAGWFEQRFENQNICIFVENVARTRALNELWFGSGKEYHDFLYVFIDRGVGCVHLVGEQIRTGYGQVAGEFGHTIIHPGGRQCYCGNHGCMEMYVSTGAITKDARMAIGIDMPQFSFDDVMEMEDHPKIEAVFMDAGTTLGYGIANLINLINPKAVILGGEVPSSSESFVRHAIDTARSHIFNRRALDTPIIVSGINRDNNCNGSIALVFNHLFKTVEIN